MPNNSSLSTIFQQAYIAFGKGVSVRSFTEKLRGLREDNDLTQAQVAEVLETSQTMYARYERGANEMPIHRLITLCRFYNVSADYFLNTAPDPRKKQKKADRNMLCKLK